jgi:hypothetical protein
MGEHRELHLRDLVGVPPPAGPGEELADVFIFTEDDQLQRALDAVAPASPATMDDRTMSEKRDTSYRDQIAAAAKPRKRESATLNGMPVDVVGMRAGESQRVTDASVTVVGRSTKIKFGAYYPQVLIACVRLPGTDTPVFTACDEDLAVIAELDADEVEHVVEIAQRLSGKTKEAEKAIVGNSGAVGED